MHATTPTPLDDARPTVRVFLIVLASFAWSGAPVYSQTVPPPAAGAAEVPVELSPFEVRGDADIGYHAGNTVSGSRLNSRLKDTPASVSPFTPEFLSDIAATNLEEMLGYAINVEAEFEDATAGFNNPPGRDTTGNDYQFRMRGMAAGAARDFVDSSVPTDLYNVERAEATSGPNSILFGLGSAGGTVALTGKRAQLNRTRTSVKAQFGSWDFQRYELDSNYVLLPKKLSVRLLGLYEDAESWRKWTLNEQRRVTGAVTYQPWRNTTLRASYEAGDSTNSTAILLNAIDQISAWNKAGRPVLDGAAVPGTARFSTSNNRFTLADQDAAVYNFKGELQSSSSFPSATLVTPDVVPYRYNLAGPGGLRTQKFDTLSLQAEQRLSKSLVVELAYFHNKARIQADGTNGSTVELRGDPNLTLPVPSDAAGTIPNPHARELYMEASWFRDHLVTSNDVFRLSTAWETNLGQWFGRHRVAGLAERSEQNRLRRWKNQILVDDNNVPISNVASPENAVNQLTHRRYFAEGDFNNYYAGDPRVTLPAFTFNGRSYHATYASKVKTNADTEKLINSFMVASQSFWWHDRVAITAGIRRDEITFRNAQEARVTDPNDSRVKAGQVVLNEFDFNGVKTTNHYRPSTFTAGAVVHATQRLSFFYNYSRNNGAPRFDRTVLPNGDVPPPTEGLGRDFGFMFDLFGDDRYFVRATRFFTAQINDAPIIPNGSAVNTADDLGGDNLIHILDALLAAGRLTQAQYDQQAVYYNAATIDLFTSGYEVEFVGNPTKNLTFRLGYSYSNRKRENFFKEIYAYFGEKIPEWRAAAAGDAALLATINNEIATIESDLDAQYQRQSSPFSTRPHKANATFRYKFIERRLKGAFVGGGARYQSKNFISRDNTTGRAFWGNEMLFVDAFAGYRTRLPGTKLPLSLQLNVKNLTNSYLVGVGRYNTTYDGLLRVYLNEPRSYRLTATMEF
jgi:outer membrane receptor protein involved in Fe transport